MIFNQFLLVLLLFIYKNAKGEPPIKLLPKSSATILNNQLVIYQPDSRWRKTKFNSYLIKSGKAISSRFEQGHEYEENLEDHQYDFEFLNAPGSIQSKGKVYMLASIQFKHRSLADASLAKRFSSLELNESGYKKSSYSNMTEPSFDHFPHFDYSSTLVGTMDENYSLLNTSLYILGGAKYFPSTMTTKIIRSFCRYNFQSNQWEDLTDLLPLNDFKPFAGHQVINVENKKLIVLGGYRTTTYNSDYTIPENQSKVMDFSKIWVFDILNQKWEQQTPYFEKPDEFISEREFYGFPVTYSNDKIYVNGGHYYIDSKNKEASFGVLDVTNWHWRWKWTIPRAKFISDQQMKYKDTLLVENNMLIIYSPPMDNCRDLLEVIDLDKEESIDQFKLKQSIDPTDNYYPRTAWKYYLLAALKFIGKFLVLPVFLVLILILLYRSKRRKINSFRPINDESEMVDIWSDQVPLIQTNLNSFQSKSNTLQNKDTTNMMNLPHFQYEIDTRFEDRELPIPNILEEPEASNHNKSHFD